MSGFEVAGIVLGVIPIALEIYDVYRARSESVFKYAEVMRNFVRTLHTAHSRLRNCLEKLLHGRIDDQLFSELLDNPKTGRWRDPDVDVKVRDLLRESYFGYIETLIAIRSSLRKLEILVGLDDNNSKSWLDLIKFPQPKYRFHRSVWKRITTCIDHSKHVELLQFLDKDIEQLEGLTSSSLDLEPIRKDQKKRTKTRQIEIVRQLAQSLHSSLSTRWLCKCPQPHFAHLQLDNLSLEEKNTFRFRLLFSYGNFRSSNQPVSWELKEVEVEPHQKLTTGGPTTVSFGPPSKSLPPSAIALKDLCEELTRAHKSKCCIGFVDDAEATHYIHKIIPSLYATGAIQSPVSLRSLISKDQAVTPTKVNLSIMDRQKYELAVLLASSVLQLNKTSWLKDHWSSDDVLFLPLVGEISPARCAYISRPFVPASLPRVSTIPAVKRPTVRNEAIFALGVALIELSLGKPLEAFVEKNDLDANGEHTMLTDFMVASKLINRVAQQEGERYTNAVNRCIYGIFDGLVPDLTNEKFREGFYRGVVVELQNVFHDFIK